MFDIKFDLNFIFVPVMLILLAILLLDKFVFKQRKTKGKGNEQYVINAAYEFLPVVVFLVVFRSFFFEYNKIPSGSMEPTLYDGDYILVNKFIYGVRLPILNSKIIPISSPNRGDVVVFRYPKDPKTYFIKRMIGLPGDVVSFQNGVLSINGKALKTEISETNQVDEYSKVFNESIEGKSHLIRDLDDVNIEHNADFLKKSNPNTLPANLVNSWTVTVPDNHYFVMGDNRDQSADSRFWGFVPEQKLVGKAIYMFMQKQPGFSMPTFKNATRIK